MQRNSTGYTVGFAAVVCVVCALLVSGAYVSLRDRQVRNEELDQQKKVLAVSGLLKDSKNPGAPEVQALFENNIEAKIVSLRDGTYVPENEIDVATYDQAKAAKDPETSEEAPPNRSQIKRVPHYARVFRVMKDDAVDMVVLPIEGLGLWGTLYGYLAVDKDGDTIRGIIFYSHKETPGLGAEVDNPLWIAKWPDRKIYDTSGKVAIRVIKGLAGSIRDAPHEVDGLSGATITSNGVTNLLSFWLGENGFQKYLSNLRNEGSET